VTRYDDVAATLKDERLAKDLTNALSDEQQARQPWTPGFLKPLTRNMLDLDGTDHARLRALVHKAFTPRLVEQLRGRFQALADDLLDAVPDSGRIDLIRDYALPLPLTVISDLLGVPRSIADSSRLVAPDRLGHLGARSPGGAPGDLALHVLPAPLVRHPSGRSAG
jgi:cytochrome P450 PksS